MNAPIAETNDERDRERADQPVDAPRQHAAGQAISTAPPSGNSQHEPAVGLDAQPCSSRSSSTSIGSRRRYSATIRPRPTATSQAATTMTIRAKIWPSMLPCMRENATSARLRGVEHQLEAEQDHERVAAHEHAAGADAEDQRRDDEVPGRAHGTSAVARRPRASSPSGASGGRRSARRGGRRRPRYSRGRRSRPPRRRARITAPTAAISSSSEASSNASRNLVRNSAPTSAACRSPLVRRRRRCPAPTAPVPSDRDRQLDEQRAARTRSDTAAAWRRARRGQRLGPAAHIGDDEHVEDHDRARVDDDLRGGDELGAQQQEQRRQRQQVADQRKHRIERVAQG